jgi:hypothetical protein
MAKMLNLADPQKSHFIPGVIIANGRKEIGMTEYFLVKLTL